LRRPKGTRRPIPRSGIVVLVDPYPIQCINVDTLSSNHTVPQHVEHKLSLIRIPQYRFAALVGGVVQLQEND